MSKQAELPYAGTSGWAGSDASRERAITADRAGITGRRQAQTISIVNAAGERGLTPSGLGGCGLTVVRGGVQGRLVSGRRRRAGPTRRHR